MGSGTGKTPTTEHLSKVFRGIRGLLAKILAPGLELKMQILYGGSVNAQNCKTLALLDDLDGFLVGGASLEPENFIIICNSGSIRRIFGCFGDKK